MNRPILLMFAVLLLTLLVIYGCPNQGSESGGKAMTVADDPHAGHDHGDEPDAVEDDPHAGHDHGDEPEVVEDDPHAGHDHGEEPEVVEDDPHAGHDHGAEDTVDAGDATAGVSLTADQVRELGIKSEKAGSGTLGRDLELTGEVAINEDMVTHVSPRIGGIISKVYRKLGDEVRSGDPMLQLDSIELAGIKSSYLAALSRVDLANQTMEREKMLLDKGISAEQEYLAAKQAWEEELISQRSIEQTLKAMGQSAKQISSLAENPSQNLTSYTVYAPVGGEIIEKHASVGEMVETGTEVFTVSNMCSVWVRFNVYQRDFADISEGMEILVDPGQGVEPATGTIDYIEPLIGEETRTAVARVVMSCMDHVLRPGLFVTGLIEVGGETAELVVPRDAVVELDQDLLIFVRSGNSFEPRVVTAGRQTAVSYELLSGLSVGEDIVIAGAFQLKAELLKGTFDPHAGHAH